MEDMGSKVLIVATKDIEQSHPIHLGQFAMDYNRI